MKDLPKYIEMLPRNRDPNMTQNGHVYAICCRPEVDCDVISWLHVVGYVVANSEVASSSSFRDSVLKKNHFATEADIDNGTKRKRIRVSPKKSTLTKATKFWQQATATYAGCVVVLEAVSSVGKQSISSVLRPHSR